LSICTSKRDSVYNGLEHKTILVEKSDKMDERDKIIKAGCELFAKYGFKKTTMDDIAKSSRKAKSTLYYYFKSKEEVLESVVQIEAEELKSKLEEALKVKESPQSKLNSYIITRMKAMRNLSNLYMAFKDEYFEMYDFINRIRKNYDDYEFHVFKNILTDGVRSGTFEIEDVDLTSYVMMMATKGIEYSFATEDNWQIEKNVNTLVNILFRGILKR